MTRQAMIFAAGKGTRMMPLTADRPKCLVAVAGLTLLDHAIATLPATSPLVVNGHYFGDQVEAALDRPNTCFSAEESLLETGGGLKYASDLFTQDAVFTQNSDAVWSNPYAAIALDAAWDPAKMDALLLIVPTDRAIGHLGSGSFEMATDGRLSRGGPWVYTGFQIIKRHHVDAVPDQVFSMNVVWERMLAQRRLYGCVFDGFWADVGYPEAIPLAEQMIADHGPV